MDYKKLSFIRYPGGKRRLLNYIIPFLPSKELIKRKYVEPFVGSGAVFFFYNPSHALLSDINPELIDLYRGIRDCPLEVWRIYKSLPNTKDGYYEIRAIRGEESNLAYRAARTLYLNRTCFKGMWRHNSNGVFNVGYGGQDRRWVVNFDILKDVSDRLKCAVLRCSDFEEVINECTKDDFVFVDPPYKPAKREMSNDHYLYGKFNFSEYQRLAKTLTEASYRGVRWAVTISSHPDILSLFVGNNIISIPKGTGNKPGILSRNSGEVLILNYDLKEELP